MKIIIFGASGNVGRLVVEQALVNNHSVTAVVHSSKQLDNRKDITVITADIYDYAQVSNAVRGHDIVISALGSWNTAKKDTVSGGITHITRAMQEHGVERLITLTGSGAYWSGDKLRPIDTLSHILLKVVAPKILQDGEAHNRTVEQSGLAWTIVRSPIMKDGKAGKYKLTASIGSPLAKISRATVAQAIIDQISDTKQITRAPVIRMSGKNYSSS